MKTFFEHSLKTYNTFGIHSIAKVFILLENIDDIPEAIEKHGIPKYILGGGSNVILPSYIEGVIRHPMFTHTNVIHQGNDILYTVGAGNNWDKIVNYTIDKGRRGIENLTAIPGNVGASPVQNIGAYGVELQDVFISCNAYNFDSKKIEILEKENCNFGYRQSIFKQYPTKYMIIDVTMKLTDLEKPVLTYKPILEHFTKIGNTSPTQKDIANAITQIRWSKLPKPQDLGNCGSFFQNPIVSKTKADELTSTYPNIPKYIQGDGIYKLSAAWLIETAGLKGYRQGNVSTYEKQPLVIVQYGNSTQTEIIDFSQHIIETIKSNFEVTLQREVNIW